VMDVSRTQREHLADACPSRPQRGQQQTVALGRRRVDDRTDLFGRQPLSAAASAWWRVSQNAFCSASLTVHATTRRVAPRLKVEAGGCSVYQSKRTVKLAGAASASPARDVHPRHYCVPIWPIGSDSDEAI
jgi:hypothetical protein